MQKKLLFLLLFTLPLASCQTVTVPNITDCTLYGQLINGGFCAETQTQTSVDLNPDDYLAFLEASPTKGPAVCQSSDDYDKITTTLDLMCRLLGNDCTLEIKQTIQSRKALRQKIKSSLQ